MASHLPVVGVLSEGVCDLVQDAAVRHMMGEKGLVEACFHTWPAAMKMLLDGYEEIIVGTRPFVAA
jgi:hypothetical protein